MAIIFCLLPATMTSADVDTHQEASKSVVEITCDILDEKGDVKVMRSTGFAWDRGHHRDRGHHVVTVLHGVVGCLKRPWVKSEANNDGTASEVLAGHLQADLALLKLDRDIGLTALQHAALSPVHEGPYFMYGYPLFAKVMEGSKIELKWGIGGEFLGALGKVFRDDDLEDLFRNQTYPTRETEILRFKDSIQSGHSGSPVFDVAGRVIAIVDGGLLEGVVGANWMIPTHDYLSELPAKEGETIPPYPSAQAKALLKSGVTDRETKKIAIEVPDVEDPSAQVPSDLTLVRRVTFGDLENFISDWDRDTYNQSRENLELFLEDRDKTNALSLDIYEDSITGATLAVPSTLALTWNPSDRTIEAATASGIVRLVVSIARKSSFDEAIGVGKHQFIDRIVDLAQWKADSDPRTFELQNCVRDDSGACDPDWHWRTYADVFYGVDPNRQVPVEMTMSIAVSDTDVLGTALFALGDFNEDLTTDDKVEYFLASAGANLLTDFARY